MYWWVFYGVLTLMAVITAISAYPLAPRALKSVPGSAYVLASVWALSNCCFFFSHPYAEFYPIIDAVIGSSFVLLWVRERRTWQVILAGLFIADTGVHVAYFCGAMPARRQDIALNLLYVCQLACVVVPCCLAVSRREHLREIGL